MLVYLHGFNSSSASLKAKQLRVRLAAMGLDESFVAPDLSHRPQQAMATLQAIIHSQGVENLTLVGSSLGGYYATWLVEMHRVKAALINPAPRPYELLRPLLGPQRNLYSGEVYDLTERHLEELRLLEVPRVTRAANYLLLVQTGDELLDYREAVVKYCGAQQVIIPGGDHGFQRFEDYIGRILEFAGMRELSS